MRSLPPRERKKAAPLLVAVTNLVNKWSRKEKGHIIQLEPIQTRLAIERASQMERHYIIGFKTTQTLTLALRRSTSPRILKGSSYV